VGKLNTQETKPRDASGKFTFTATKNNPANAGPYKTNDSLSGGDRDMGDRNRGYRTLDHKHSGIKCQ